MKSKHYNVVARLGVSLTVVLSLFAPALAAENVSSGKPTATKQPAFRLNAQVNQNPQLSRDEGDAIISHLAPAAPPDGASTLPSGFPRTMPAAPAPSDAALSGNVSANQQATLPPQAYLSEYGVDWSGWISQMAARWHYNLKRLEAQSNVCFVTERPALIQFTCASNGQVGNFFLKQSSGVYAYDQLQMLALSQVTPLPPFPKGTRCATITLVQGWESHTKKPGESGFDPSAFGRRFPMEKVQQWVRSN